MSKPLYYLKNEAGKEVGVVLSIKDYRTLIRLERSNISLAPSLSKGEVERLLQAAGSAEMIPPKGGKPKGSAQPVTPRGRPVSDVVIEERDEREANL